MASLRNAVPRKINKERAQPSNRKRLGLLEKHKDYVLRARDYHRKETAIATLRRKAAFRNPDEFYFGMSSSRTKEGVHQVEHGIERLPHGYIKLLKTQDQAYINMKRAQDSKKIERLKGELHFLTEDRPMNSHTVFLDSEGEADSFDPAEHFSTAPELVERAFNRPRLETLQTEGAVGGGMTSKELAKVRKRREQAYKELQERLERTCKMTRVLERMKVEKDVMVSRRSPTMLEAAPHGVVVLSFRREAKLCYGSLSTDYAMRA